VTATEIPLGPSDPGAPSPQIWPLMPQQQSLWFLDNFNPGSPFYVISLGLVLRGRLNPAALWAALDDIVARHEALRARFLTVGGRPYQVFVPGQETGHDLRDLSGDPSPETTAQAHLDELTSAPFELRTDPPLRVRLLRLADDHHILLLVAHHIVFDDWSIRVLLSDLSTAYAAHTSGQRPVLPPLDTSLGEYAALLDERFRGQGGGGLETELAYWRDALHAAPLIDLPTDFPRPAHRTFAGAICHLDLDPETTAALDRLARDLRTSLFTVLVSAFTTAVSRLSGRDDVVIGIPLAGRTETATHGLIGFFANALPLRVNLSGADGFSGVLERHRQPVHELLTRQHVPFASVVDNLAPKRSANRNPYFDICFQYAPAADEGVSFDGVALEIVSTDRKAAQFDLSCDVLRVGDQLRLQFEYSTELFTERTVRSHGAAFVQVLHEAVSGSDAASGNSGSERNAVSGLAKDSADRTVPRAVNMVPGGLAGIVAAQAALRPAAPAVHGGRSLTFRELDEAAARFASVLAAEGVVAGDRVGVLMSPSADLAVAMLGVLRIGAVYVPCDLRHPAARIAEMTRQAECRVLVHDQPLTAAEPAVPLVRFDVARYADQPLFGLGDLDPHQPAYIIFTSGSTGRPKGVVVHQLAAVGLADAAAEVYQITPGDVALQMASPAVDVAVEEFFGSWRAGAAVLVHGPVIDDLSALVRRHGLTVLNLPAALWHEWTRQAVAGETIVPDCVRLVIAGSDRVDPGRVRQWHAGPGTGIRLLNCYGATEAAVTSSWYDTAELDADAAATVQVPIGRPFPHVSLYILNESGEPVVDGVPGELWIGGYGVALGYLGDPGGTDARFRPDPFQEVSGTRMYRTGDLVRRLPSGVLDFRGRIDDQVKIRGTRIELAEVERAGGEVPGIADFVADVRPDSRGTPRLVGYIRLGRPAEEEAGLGRDRVEQWRQVHDEEVFNEVADGQQADLNASGWISSYTREPIEPEAMAEWRDEVVDRILAEPPGQVLEIGCGTGMILLPVLPHAERYVGMDISPRALRYVADQLSASGLEPKVQLMERAAHELDALGDDQFDLIVLNSVVQYFPGEQYLTGVIESAWRLLRPGGRIVIGDVRDLTLLPAFHLSVQRFRHPELTDPQELVDTVAESVETENELCLAPAFFDTLATRLTGLAHVDTLAKTGRAETEMNGYRYDVVLHRAPHQASPQQASLQQADGSDLTLDRFGTFLDGLSGRDAWLTAVPDRRLGGSGLHPADLLAVAAARGRDLVIRQTGNGLLGIVVTEGPTNVPIPKALNVSGPAASALANRPLETAHRRAAVAAVREHLGRQLPEAMIPSRLVFVSAIPLSASGKVDRPRLPDPPRATAREPAATAPATDTERALAAALAQVLGVPSVAVADNLFEIGVDSLSWLQIMSRCLRAGIRLTARDIFEHQTVGELAAVAEARQSVAPANPVDPEDPRTLREAPLTPIQQWFMQTFPVGRDRQNQSQWFELPAGCPTEVLRQALHDVAAHHPALASLSFEPEPEPGPASWTQRTTELPPPAALPLTEVTVTEADLTGPRRDQVLAEAADQAQSSLSVLTGPLFRVVLFRTPGPALLLWVIHHLVVDAVSWQFLAEDLDAALGARRRGLAPSLPPGSASFLEWSVWSGRAAAELDPAELGFWRTADAAAALAVPERHPEAEAVYATAHDRTVTVPAFRAVGGQLPGDLVLAVALTGIRAALAPTAGQRSGSVWLESHGRPLDGRGPDVSRTVGWFTALYPFVVDEADATAVRARLAAVPSAGAGYGRARYRRGEPFRGAANVVVNYLGAASGAQAEPQLNLRPTRSHAAAADVADDAPMPFALELNLADAPDGALVARCTFGACHFDGPEADALAAALEQELRTAFASPAAFAGPATHTSPAASGPDTSLVPDQTRAAPAYARLLAGSGPLDAAYPLMPMQQIMLNRHLLSPAGDTNYNEIVFTLTGDLEPDVFRAAWKALAARHDVLRTSVEWSGLSQPIQLVHREAPDPIRFRDWSELSAARVRRRLQMMLEQERAERPPLSGAPPYQLTLIKTGSRSGQLVWVDHHILLDGWSTEVLVSDLLTAYSRLSQGAPAFPGMEPAPAYRDYVRWVRGRATEEARPYWRGALEGFTTATQLPFDTALPASAAMTGDYEEADQTLPADLVAALRRVAAEHRTTLGSVLAAGWAALLQRFTGDHRVTFGMALNGRPAELGDVSAMVGLYQTTLPLAVEVETGLPVRSLLQTVTRQAWRLGEVSAASSLLDVYAWSGVPASRALFHSVMVVQNFGPGGPGPARPLTAEMAHARIITGAPLTIVFMPDDDSLRLVWDTRVFAGQTAGQLLGELTAILEFLAHDAERLLGDLPVPRFTPHPVDRPAAPPRHEPVLEPPQGPAEELVARAWSEVLGIGPVSRHRNLFDAGANSVTIVRLHDRLGELSGTPLSLEDLFQYPTVQAMASLLGRPVNPADPATGDPGPGDPADGVRARSQRRRAALSDVAMAAAAAVAARRGRRPIAAVEPGEPS
jgi:amino acid adenylation domain-containing protein